MSQLPALRVHGLDNVATVFHNNVLAGTEITVTDRQGGRQSLRSADDIPYGHKVAVVPIPAGAHIVKYGQVIGAATRDIAVGEHVHVHDLDSLRGRGDL